MDKPVAGEDAPASSHTFDSFEVMHRISEDMQNFELYSMETFSIMHQKALSDPDRRPSEHDLKRLISAALEWHMAATFWATMNDSSPIILARATKRAQNARMKSAAAKKRKTAEV